MVELPDTAPCIRAPWTRDLRTRRGAGGRQDLPAATRSDGGHDRARGTIAPCSDEQADPAAKRLPNLLARARARPRSERALVREAQRGDAEASRSSSAPLARAHRAAYLVVGDPAAAEDIAQEAFLAAIRALDSFDRRRPFGPWLHRIAVNRAIDFARARRCAAEAETRPTFARRSRPCSTGSPTSCCGAARARARAPCRDRPALRARVHAGRDRASILELPRGTVNSRLRRGARLACDPRSPRRRDREPRPRPRAAAARAARPGREGGGGAFVGNRPRRLRGPRPVRPSPPSSAGCTRDRPPARRRWQSASARPGRRSATSSPTWSPASIGQPNAKPALRSLPAAGELWSGSPQGAWVVPEDGSKRLLGDYARRPGRANGAIVAASDGRELVALEPGRGCALEVHARPERSGIRAGRGTANAISDYPDRLSKRRRPSGGRRGRQRGQRPPSTVTSRR